MEVNNQRKTSLEKWKEAHREYYLAQKRRLAARPEYKALRRERYRAHVDELTLLGILPRKRGRPTMYEGTEATEMKRQRAREASARYRAKLISQRLEKDEYESSETASETSDRSSSSDGSSADGAQIWHRAGPQNAYWPLSTAGG
jgi:hypothetical protein